MVFLPSRLDTHQESQPVADRAISPGARAIIDLIDVVGTIHDVDHLQSVAFLAQEFGLLVAPTFLFGSRRGDDGQEPRRPHSLLLEGHFYALLCEKVIDRDTTTGRLRPRRDLYAVPYSGLAGRRLGVLGALSKRDVAVFAAAVLRLTHDGCHAGSNRRDAAFHAAVAQLAVLADATDEAEQPVDTAAIRAARQRLMPAEPVLLMGGQLIAVGG